MFDFTIEKPAHFSPSSINSFISYRPQWFINYILRQRGPGNPAMFRGSSVEDGVNFFVEKRQAWSNTVTDADDRLIIAAVEEAKRKFNERCDEAGDRNDKMLDSIPSCVYSAIHHLVELWGKTVPTMQHKISTKLPGVETTIIGYLDYLVPSEIQDLKVSARTPSGLSQGYKIQGAVYNYALQLPVSFHFVVPLKTETKTKVIDLSQNDADYYLKYATQAAQRMENIYKILEKPFIFQNRDDIGQVFQDMCFPDLDAFWNQKDKETVQALWEIEERNQASSFGMPDLPNM